MEDQGQYFSQCVTEVKEAKLLTLVLQDAIGPAAVIVFNDTQISKIMSHYQDIGSEYEGNTRSMLLIKN